MSNTFVADFSLALINRTGAYQVCKDVIQHLPHKFQSIRYWRFALEEPPDGVRRRLLARAMLFELSRLSQSRLIPRLKSRRMTPTVFFDPLYVLQADLGPQDIVLCYDVGPVTHPALYDAGTVGLYARAYRRIRQAGPGMVFVSDASRHEFATLFGDGYRFMETIPLYVRSAIAQGEESAPAGVSRPFFLTVGALEIRKNYQRIIPAFERSGLHRGGYSYIFCGPRGNYAAEISALARGAAGVKRLGYISDAELRWLYRRAEGFILPSLLEGFGIPALEAAQFGLVPLVSSGGALEEAAGAGAVLADPLSTDSIAEGFRLLAQMPDSERERRKKLLLERAAELSLENYLQRWAELLDRP